MFSNEGMRWDAQALLQAPGDGSAATPALLPLAGLVRSVTTPEFAGITFHEVTAKSVLNRVPAGSKMPFEWTVNPYRGCSHACVYCFARKSHTYLDFDAGLDFDSQVVVKVNAADVLRKELARPSWTRPQVALGTNTDPYQRAEGRYRLMPGIIAALADSGTPLSILTKGTLLARDIPLLKSAAAQVPVGLGISLAMTDEALSEAIEPGTPGPRATAQARFPAPGGGSSVRRHGDAHPAVALGQRRSPGLPFRVAGRSRRHRRQRGRPVPQTRHPGMVHASGSPQSTRSWLAATAASTAQAPTRPRSTAPGWRARSATSRRGTASPSRPGSATGTLIPATRKPSIPAGSIPEARQRARCRRFRPARCELTGRSAGPLLVQRPSAGNGQGSEQCTDNREVRRYPRQGQDGIRVRQRQPAQLVVVLQRTRAHPW